MKKLIVALIRLYQRYISRFTPPSCRFYPTCSQYSITAFERFGFWKGAFLTIRRIVKCHPFHPGGFDEVPKKKQASAKHHT